MFLQKLELGKEVVIRVQLWKQEKLLQTVISEGKFQTFNKPGKTAFLGTWTWTFPNHLMQKRIEKKLMPNSNFPFPQVLFWQQSLNPPFSITLNFQLDFQKRTLINHNLKKLEFRKFERAITRSRLTGRFQIRAVPSTPISVKFASSSSSEK